MKQVTNIEQICERLFQLEKDHSLLELDIAGVKIYQLMRMSIYYDIAKATGVFDNPHPGKKRRKSFVNRCFSTFADLTVRNPLFVTGNVDAIVFPHSRKVRDADGLIDVYSHYLIDHLEREGKRCCVIEKSKKIATSKGLVRNSKRCDIIRLLNKLQIATENCQLSITDNEALKAFSLLIDETFNIKINLYKKLNKRLNKFHHNYAGYKRLFKRLKPKQIYVVVAYFGWGEMIKAAKDLGIEVIEIQHGVYSRYHLGYSYPNQSKALSLDFFPDKFLVWGDYWASMPELPLKQHACLSVGFSYFHIKQKLVDKVQRKSKQIVILSQGAIGERFAEQVATVAGLLKDYQLIYKLHPSEYLTWEQSRSVTTLAENPNVTIIGEGSDLYQLLAESEYQFGVFSTAVFEGVGMGCKTILFDLPGVEYMERMVDQGLCVKWDGCSDIIESINAANGIDPNNAQRQLFGSV